MRHTVAKGGSVTGRRGFIKALAALPVIPSSISNSPAVEPVVRPQQQAEFKPSATAEALVRLVESRYGKYLAPEQLEEIRRQIERGLQGAERLRAVKLRNSDEPDFAFNPFL